MPSPDSCMSRDPATHLAILFKDFSIAILLSIPVFVTLKCWRDMLTLLGGVSPCFTTRRVLVPIVLFWALVVSAGRKAVTTHCATLTKRVPCADLV